MPISAIEKQMREDRRQTIVRIHDCLEELKGLNRQKLMLDKYLGDDGGETDLTVQTISVQVLQDKPPKQENPPADPTESQPEQAPPRQKRTYTRRAKGNNLIDPPRLLVWRCNDCKKRVEVGQQTVKGEMVTKCLECGGLQVEKIPKE